MPKILKLLRYLRQTKKKNSFPQISQEFDDFWYSGGHMKLKFFLDEKLDFSE